MDLPLSQRPYLLVWSRLGSGFYECASRPIFLLAGEGTHHFTPGPSLPVRGPACFRRMIDEENGRRMDAMARIADMITPTLDAMGFLLVRVKLVGTERPTLQIMFERDSGGAPRDGGAPARSEQRRERQERVRTRRT